MLTYASGQKLAKGSLVALPLRNREELGIVVDATAKPSFKTKEIGRVLTEQALPATSLKLLDWIAEYYPAPWGYITSLFMPRSLLQTAHAKPLPLPGNATLGALPPLTREQKDTLNAIEKSGSRSILLHGDTGSGKTRIYIELARKQLENGKSVLILTPEIGLTPQLIREFENAFKEQALVLHSNLTISQRRTAWLQVLTATQPLIVIGPRSALFAPFSNLGLVVIDEAHETAYKQEQAPRYDARRVAGKLAELHKAQLVMASATPPVSEYYIAEARKVPILRMTKLATNEKTAAPAIEAVLARDKERFTRHPQLSDDLLDALQLSLNKGEQSLVFLNRRGSARLVLCKVCGWQAICPNCGLPLTYHGDHHNLRCHTCGYTQPAVSICPECGNTDIVFRNLGTKSIVEALVHFFPKAKIQRFDTDNLKGERFEEHFANVSSGKVDILVGTQLLAKGLDLPKLGFVGVVSADTSLSFPDYTAEERTYQMVSQVIGRIGRGHRSGKALIQTFHPGSPAIQSALGKDWSSFYMQELAERQQFGFPPFFYLLKLTAGRKTAAAAQKAAESFAGELQYSGLAIQIIGPSPSFYEKLGGKYHWQLIIKAKDRRQLINVIDLLPSGWTYDLDPSNLL
jgi:primosomal protein N' (replication factor Y)